MQLKQEQLIIQTSGRGMIDITRQISKIIDNHSIKQGLCHLFLAHTSASLVLCENADPDVRRDLEDFISKLVPDNNNRYRHHSEGVDDMPAHIRTILTQNSLSIPVSQGTLALGSWQGIFLWEHRLAPHSRTLVITLL